ncbi:MAG: TatD family hydrolase [Planctomycetes bacterium]|nr:TatD family hydrolase [Planctomycetota bacterium]
MIFDTHCHLGYDDPNDGAPDVARARDAGVELLLDVGIDLASSLRARARASQLDGVFSSAGLHPNDCGKIDAEWGELERLCRSTACTAVGETGLDFFRDHTTPEQQIEAFERHLELAVEIDKPVIVHCRDAFDRTFEVLRRFPGVRGVMHCFSGGPADAERALELGFYLSFAGPLTYKKSDELRAAAAAVPADRMLVETDAPFLPPQSRRGKRNEPALVVETLTKLAEVRGIEFEAAAERTTANARTLFRV